jgi:NAD(P)-dependent dehydrogenase (short-subunit alcohol dehydrogenase family)
LTAAERPQYRRAVGSLAGTSAAITGAGRGIGRALALRVAAAGHPVALQARTPAQLAAVQAEVEALGGRAAAIPGDVTRAAAADALLDGAAQLAPLGIAVASAGQALSLPVVKTSEADLRGLFDVNVVASFHLLKAAASRMLAAGRGGRIVLVGSTASVRGARYTAAYSATKHALLGLVRSAALELAPKGITVNLLCPGWVDTPMFEATLANIRDKTGRTVEQARQDIEATIPSRTVLVPDEVAAALAYLISDAAAQVTGQALIIDGGSSL